jgi:hypothetical protein
MDLEKMLQEKAAAKAEQLRQEQLASEQAQLAEQEHLEAKRVADEEQEELDRLEGLRTTIAGFDSQITTTQELLTELTEVHQDALGSAESLAEQKRQFEEAETALEALFNDPIYKSVLENEGIHSVAELLEAEGFNEAEQVTKVMEGKGNIQSGKDLIKEKVGERLKVKREAQEALRGEKPEINLVYEELVGGLQERITELEGKRKEAFWQTPEGKESKREEMKAVVADKLENSLSDYRVTDYWKKWAGGGVSFKAVDLAENMSRESQAFALEEAVYGKDEVRETIIAVVKSKIDKVLDKRYLDEAGGRAKEEVLEKLATFKENWEELRVGIPSLLERRQELTAQLVALLGSEQGADLKMQIEKYDQRSPVDIQKLAEYIVDSCSALQWESKGHNGELFGDVDSAIATTVYLQKCLLESSAYQYEQYQYSALSSKEEGYGANTTPQVPNPSTLLDVLNKQNLVFERVQQLINSPVEQSYVTFKNEVLHSALPRMSIKLASNEKLGQVPSKLEEFKSEVEVARKKLEAEKIETHTQFEAAFTDAEQIVENQTFRSKNQDALNRVASYEKKSKVVTDMLPRLDARTLDLREEDKVVMDSRGNNTFVEYENFESARLLLITNKGKKEAELEAINSSISAIYGRASSEGDGFLGGKKRQREGELEPLRIEKTNKEAELSDIEKEFKILFSRRDTLNELNRILEVTRETGLDVRFSEEPQTVGELVSALKEVLAGVSLSADDMEIKKKSEELGTKAEAAERRKNESRRGSNY